MRSSSGVNGEKKGGQQRRTALAQGITKMLNYSYISPEGYPSEHYTFESKEDALAFMEKIIAVFPANCDAFMTRVECHVVKPTKNENYERFRWYYLGAKDVDSAVAKYDEEMSLIGITNKVYTSRFNKTPIEIKNKWFLYSKEYRRVALPNNVYGAVYELRKLFENDINNANTGVKIVREIVDRGKLRIIEDRVNILDRAMKNIRNYAFQQNLGDYDDENTQASIKSAYYKKEIEKEKKRRPNDPDDLKLVEEEEGGRRRRKSKKARKSKGRKSRKNGRSRRRRR